MRFNGKKKIFFLFVHVVCFLLCKEYCIASTENILSGILNLTETEFFNVDQSVLAQREFQFVDLDFRGVVVNAPREIRTNCHNKMPLFIATRYDGDRSWDVPLKDNCILVGTNLQNGAVHFSKAFVSERKLASRWRATKAPRGPKPPGLPIRAASIRPVDVRRRLNINWNTGTWSLGVIYYDWASNNVVVQLKGDEKIKPGPPARPVSPEPNIRDVKALPCYLPMSKTPESPESGVTFTAKFCEEDGRQRLNVFGAFAVPARDFHLPRQRVVHQFKDGRQENVAAVIPVTMAVLGLDWDEPMQFDWAVPVYGEPLSVGMLARGCFAIDTLAGREAAQLSAGKYICYVIMDGKIFGPKPFKISGVK